MVCRRWGRWGVRAGVGGGGINTLGSEGEGILWYQGYDDFLRELRGLKQYLLNNLQGEGGGGGSKPERVCI